MKKKWDYEELGREKTIDFWVIITNSGSGGELFMLWLSHHLKKKNLLQDLTISHVTTVKNVWRLFITKITYDFLNTRLSSQCHNRMRMKLVE